MASPECVWAVRAVLGEGPVYDPRSGDVLFVDIKGQRLFRLPLERPHERQEWSMPDLTCWVLPRARGDYVCGLRDSLNFLTLSPFTLTPFARPDPERPGNRFNDAKVDAAGRIWFGSLENAQTQPLGRLFRLDADLSVTRHDDDYAVANGPTFSPDGRTLYHTDSDARTIYAFALSDDGQLSGKRVFVRFEDASWGYPDGMTTDAEGGVWVAHWDGARISRFTPDGALDRSIALPVSRVTSCVFAGPDLSRMFVTTASLGREDEALAGALFEVDPGVRGMPATAFAG